MAAIPWAALARITGYASALLWANWPDIERQFARADNVDQDLYGYKFVAEMGMKANSGDTGFTEKMQSGIHFLNITDDSIDDTWTNADFTAVETGFDTFWGTYKTSFVTNDIRLERYKWYAFGPGISAPNPVARVTEVTPSAGGAASGYCHQVATTVTLRTPLRRHWGRFYLPYSPNVIGAGGQLTSANVDTVATAANTFLRAPIGSQGVYPVVWDRNRKTVFNMTSLEVDSVPDIQRRRRPQLASYRKIIDT